MCVPGPFLCQRNPATTQSAVRWCLILSIARLPGWYGASSRLATTPSSPAPSNRSNQSAAGARSRVAGVRWTGGSTRPRPVSSRARRSAWGTARRSSSPSARRSQATKHAGDSSASMFTRDAAGWIRSSSASNSSAPSRGDHDLAVEDAALGQRGSKRSGQLRESSGPAASGRGTGCRTSSPSRKTIARKPSHLGSYSQPSSVGKSVDGLGQHRLERRLEGQVERHRRSVSCGPGISRIAGGGHGAADASGTMARWWRPGRRATTRSRRDMRATGRPCSPRPSPNWSISPRRCCPKAPGSSMSGPGPDQLALRVLGRSDGDRRRRRPVRGHARRRRRRGRTHAGRPGPGRSSGSPRSPTSCRSRDDAFDAARVVVRLPARPEPGAALRETRRVLRPGGVLAYVTWLDDERVPAGRDPRRRARRVRLRSARSTTAGRATCRPSSAPPTSCGGPVSRTSRPTPAASTTASRSTATSTSSTEFDEETLFAELEPDVASGSSRRSGHGFAPVARGDDDALPDRVRRPDADRAADDPTARASPASALAATRRRP